MNRRKFIRGVAAGAVANVSEVPQVPEAAAEAITPAETNWAGVVSFITGGSDKPPVEVTAGRLTNANAIEEVTLAKEDRVESWRKGDDWEYVGLASALVYDHEENGWYTDSAFLVYTSPRNERWAAISVGWRG